MSFYSVKQCKICLRNDINCVFVKDFECESLVNKLLNFFKEYTDSNGITLCLWCKAIVKKIKKLLDVAKATRMNKEQTETIQINYLTFYNNPHIDIPPKGYITEKDIKVKTAKKDVTPIKKILTKESTFKLGKLKTQKLDEMNFDVFYLNVDEQRKEIEDKKMTEAYKKMAFQCEDCGISFMFEVDFEEHQKRHDPTAGPYGCNICRLRFKSSEVLSQHTLAHRRRFVCRSCGTKLKRWTHCMIHRVTCGSNSSPAVCSACTKIFRNQYSLKIHIKTVHEKRKEYICEHCNKAFGTKQRLTVHTRSHTGLKPFSCDKCPKSFATGSNLRAHSKVHSVERRHYCVECNKYYKTEKSLKRHFLEASRHAGEGRYPCKECAKSFLTEKILEKHTSTHLVEHRCVQCLKVFSNNANLRKHVRSIHTKTEA